MLYLVQDDSTFRTDVGQFDTPLSDEFQRLVYVLRFLNAHSWIPVISSERGIS